MFTSELTEANTDLSFLEIRLSANLITMLSPGDDDDIEDEDEDWTDIDDEDFEDMAEDQDDIGEMEIENDIFDEEDDDHLPDDDF
jgi:hypothetical protein